MDEVARAAGISRATLHRHFAGRDALVRALEALGIAECEAALEAARLDDGPAEEARAASGEGGRTGRRAPRLPLHREPAVRGRGSERGLDPARRPHRAPCSGAARTSGEFRIDLTPAWLTEALYGLHGLRRLGRVGRPRRPQGLHPHDRRAAARRRTQLTERGIMTSTLQPATATEAVKQPGPLARAVRPRARRAAGGRRRDRPRPRDPLHQRGPEADRHPAAVDRRRLLVRHRGPARLHGQPRRPHRPQADPARSAPSPSARSRSSTPTRRHPS